MLSASATAVAFETSVLEYHRHDVAAVLANEHNSHDPTGIDVSHRPHGRPRLPNVGHPHRPGNHHGKPEEREGHQKRGHGKEHEHPHVHDDEHEVHVHVPHEHGHSGNHVGLHGFHEAHIPHPFHAAGQHHDGLHEHFAHRHQSHGYPGEPLFAGTPDQVAELIFEEPFAPERHFGSCPPYDEALHHQLVYGTKRHAHEGSGNHHPTDHAFGASRESGAHAKLNEHGDVHIDHRKKDDHALGAATDHVFANERIAAREAESVDDLLQVFAEENARIQKNYRPSFPGADPHASLEDVFGAGLTIVGTQFENPDLEKPDAENSGVAVKPSLDRVPNSMLEEIHEDRKGAAGFWQKVRGWFWRKRS